MGSLERFTMTLKLKTQLVSQLVGAFSPVNRRELHQGYLKRSIINQNYNGKETGLRVKLHTYLSIKLLFT